MDMLFSILVLVAAISVYKAILAIRADRIKRKRAEEEFNSFEREHPPR